MEVLYFLEKLRNPVLDEIMLLITRFGEEAAFLAVAIIVYWCIDKRRGYYIMAVGFLSTMLCSFFKLLFAQPRPWVVDPKFTIVEKARASADGFSLPSGHTATAVGTFGSLAMITWQPWLKRIFLAITVLVPLSRMYLGVHTPLDVFFGAGLALTFVYALRPMVTLRKEQGIRDVFGMMVVVALGLVVFVELQLFPFAVDEHNLQSGLKNAYTMLGCTVAAALVYRWEKKYVNFDPSAPWYIQMLKVTLGLATVFAIKEGLRGPLEAVLPIYPARSVRYFLIVVWAGVFWPMTFRYFAKLGVKK